MPDSVDNFLYDLETKLSLPHWWRRAIPGLIVVFSLGILLLNILLLISIFLSLITFVVSWVTWYFFKESMDFAEREDWVEMVAVLILSVIFALVTIAVAVGTVYIFGVAIHVIQPY